MYSMAIGNNELTGMKFRRRLLGMTQAQLAERLFCKDGSELQSHHQVQISRYENGHRWPSREMLEQIASCLRCTVSDLFKAPEAEPEEGVS